MTSAGPDFDGAGAGAQSRRSRIAPVVLIWAFSHLAPVSAGEPDVRAQQTLQALSAAEKTVLTHGIMPLPFGANPRPIPREALPGAGFVPGIPRLGVPPLKETDAGLGVAYTMGARKDGATAMPSALALASSWNPALARQVGAVIGAEARAKGFNVLLAGGANLVRDPRNGRNFEYLSEDPLLTGLMVGNAIAGVQSNHILSTIKHFAFNGQETGRQFADVKIAEGAARESDLLAFQIGIEIGQPGAVMCAYNRFRGERACGSDTLLNGVLKGDWAYPGFVMSDWGAVAALDYALKGLDQQSGAQLDPEVFLGDKLAAAAAEDPRYAGRLDDMNRRILRSIYAVGLDRETPVSSIDGEAHSRTALENALQGIVLLRNQRNLLPLDRSARRIAVIGGYADRGVLSGGGSSQTHAQGGPSVTVPGSGAGLWNGFASQQYHGASPLAAIKALAAGADIRFRDGHYQYDAVMQARHADVAIVFATRWSSEGFDQPDLSLPDGQDALIDAVAAANPNTIVVLETGNPIAMPWLHKTAAVIQAWYPGSRGGEAIAAILFGQANPSGRLPVTFPATLEQLPRPRLDGYDEFEPDFAGKPPRPDARLRVDYDIEGSDLGYRWNARREQKALFPFGFGLSYSSFRVSDLMTDGRTATAKVANLGARDGATVVQLYLQARNGERRLRLVAFERVALPPGATRTVPLTIDPRLLADWQDGAWQIREGEYRFALGDHAEALHAPVTVPLKAVRWRDR